MVLHPHYDHIRTLVDHRFVRYRRRAAAEGLHMERIEMWHDLLEAGLAAAKTCAGEPPDPAFDRCVLDGVETRYLKMLHKV